MIARYAALGLHQKDIAARTGYTRERVNILLASPAMNALVLDYASKLTDKFAEMADAYLDLATSNMMAAERQIADKLDEADEEGVTLPI
jgi:plasmid maintenance system antidote protein VapI